MLKETLSPIPQQRKLSLGLQIETAEYPDFDDIVGEVSENGIVSNEGSSNKTEKNNKFDFTTIQWKRDSDFVFCENYQESEINIKVLEDEDEMNSAIEQSGNNDRSRFTQGIYTFSIEKQARIQLVQDELFYTMFDARIDGYFPKNADQLDEDILNIFFEITVPQFSINVYRKLTDFIWLRSMMMKDYPLIFIPPLPDNLEKKTDIKIGTIKGLLNIFLSSVVGSDILRNSAVFRSFIFQVAHEEFEQEKKSLRLRQTPLEVSSALKIVS